MEKFQDRFFEEVRERLKILNIKAVLFDFDDTLICTGELFTKYMDEFVEIVSKETGLSFEVVRSDLERFNDEEYKKQGVNPERWSVVVQRMTEEREGYGESAVKNLEVLMKIYFDEPKMKPGAMAMLEILKSAGVRMSLVTHANVEWTQRKLESTGIGGYFETINIVDENRHKGPDDWFGAAVQMSVLPSECLILGDSLGGDIIAGATIGAKTMWLHKGNNWSMYRTGELPAETVVLDSISQMLSALDLLR